MRCKVFCLQVNKNMDNVYKMSMLLDFYGQMLTKRQYEVWIYILTAITL